MPKKRILWIGILLVICIAGQWMLRSGHAAADSSNSQTLLPHNPSPADTASAESQNLDLLHRQLVRQLITMILIVALFGVGLWWFARRYSKGLMGGKGNMVTVAETIPLGPRKMVHILQVGSRKLLLGSTADSIRFLADITDAVELPSTLHSAQKGDSQ
jgi:flagellar biogenesis protein FliO